MLRLAWIGLACSVLPCLAVPASAGTRDRGPYSHALQVEARREAFWRGHRQGRSLTDRAEVDQVTAARQQDYWQSQIRGRALCQAYGGCL